MNIGLLHPGAMGATLGRTLRNAEHSVCWVATGRSAESTERAQGAGLTPVADLASLCAQTELVLSVCPPEAALAVAESVHALGFQGLYVDANAVAPATAARIADLFGEAYVDGGIIGPPALQEGTTRLYLSGGSASAVAALFQAGPCAAEVVSGDVTAASALKMCYAAYTKGLSALLLGVGAAARAYGIDAALAQEWERSQPGLGRRLEGTAKATAPKAWRFAPEMREIATTLAAVGLPAEFHEGAAQIYERMASLKTTDGATLDDVLTLLLRESAD